MTPIAQPAPKPRTIVIVDDSRIVRERLIAMLNELPGVEIVGQAASVPEAIETIRRLMPDTVILDIRMPGGTGLDVLRDIKQLDPAPLVIVLTNYAAPAYREKCRQAGADFFFDKSTEFDRIPPLFERQS